MAYDKTSPAAGETGAVSQPKILANFVAIEAALGSGTLGQTNTVVQGNVLYGSAANTLSVLAPGTAGQVLKTGGADANPSWATRGIVVQKVNTQSGAVNTGTTVMPHDDTIPQKTEGDEYMTLAITPKSATNKLRIEVFVCLASSSTGAMTAALFQDTTANALAGASGYIADANGYVIVAFPHYMDAGTTSETTFKVRAGLVGAGTTTFNGVSGGRKLGGVMASSITITEIAVD